MSGLPYEAYPTGMNRIMYSCHLSVMNVDVPVDRRARMRRIEVNPWRVSRTVERRVQVTRSATVVNQPTCVHQPSVSSLNSVTIVLDRRVVSNRLRLKRMMSASRAEQSCDERDNGFHKSFHRRVQTSGRVGHQDPRTRAAGRQRAIFQENRDLPRRKIDFGGEDGYERHPS